MTIEPQASLRRLLTWLSPSFPVGAFSYSHGLEWAVGAGDVRDRATLVAWLAALLRHGQGRSDGILLAHAWRAARGDDLDALHDLAELAAALASGRERHLETTAQGAAFLAALRTAWPVPLLDRLATHSEEGPAYPVAVGAAAAAHGLDLAPALHAFLHGVVANLVSAGVRLIPLGQSDGLRALAALDDAIAEAAEAAPALGLDRLGGLAWRSDIAALRHETQHTRLFRS
jgi:urease accessory protein